MTPVSVRFTKLRPQAQAPEYGSTCAAGADLYACLDAGVTIAPGETRFIGTGLAAALPDGCAGLIFGRSGLACKRGLAPANKVGVLDSDYRGEIMIALHNHGQTPQTIEPGERIAQLVLVPYLAAQFIEADSLDETARGTGGFGSTGR